MNLKEMQLEGTEWIYQAKDMGQVAGSCDHTNETSGFKKCAQ